MHNDQRYDEPIEEEIEGAEGTSPVVISQKGSQTSKDKATTKDSSSEAAKNADADEEQIEYSETMKVREGVLQPAKHAPNLDEMLIDQSGSNTHTFGRRSRAENGDSVSVSRNKPAADEVEDEATELDREGTFNPNYAEYHKRDLEDP